MKRSASKAIAYLTLDAMKAILETPDTTCLIGRRDLVLLSLMYDMGSRVQEIADLIATDVRLENPPTVKVTGKGNKSRLVPLMSPTAKLLDQYMSEHDLKCIAHRSYPLFQNRSRDKLTRDGSLASPSVLAHVMCQKYVESLPLNRQEQQFARLGYALSRQTMVNWMIYGAETWLTPLYQAMKVYLLRQDVLHADETRCRC